MGKDPHPMTDAEFEALSELLETKPLTRREMQAIDECLDKNLYSYGGNGWGDLVSWLQTVIHLFVFDYLSGGE